MIGGSTQSSTRGMQYYKLEAEPLPGSPDGHPIWPVVWITIAVNGAEVNVPAIADLGADRTLVSAEFVSTFGVQFEDLDGERQVLGLGACLVRTLHADVAFLGHHFASEIDVAAPRVFRFPFHVVGRNDFFKTFDVHVFWRESPPFVLVGVPTGKS